ncbi:MAG: 4Fe-4S dicluster domain-containing protein [Desulfurococcales archaeon]|nr:4Fe-4S dicluster domain-containing protein [Desulfurococcales archaeon]
MAKYGLLIDLSRCIGCRACEAACKVENFVPPGKYWLYVLEWEMGEYPNVKRVFVPMNCMHCENPACIPACPVNAITKNEYGVVLVDYNKCIGCKYCVAACPYGAIDIYEGGEWFPGSKTPYELIPPEKRHPLHRFQKGKAFKCTLCYHRWGEAVERGEKPGTRPETTPACVLVCPAGARMFGDLEDPSDPINSRIAEKRAIQLKKEFGTRPQVYYITTG